VKDLKNIIKNLWYAKYNSLKMFNDYWLSESSIRNFSAEELRNFQNLKDLHFCTSRLDNLEQVMFDRSKNLNVLEYEKLMTIADSDIGYDENQRKILSSREQKISGWVTANHIFFLTFLSTYFDKKTPLKIVEFGGGFGNVCRLMFARKKYKIEKYSIIDQKGMQQVQDFFLKETLSENDYKNINLIESRPDIQFEESYDLFISNHAITEFDTVKYFEHCHLMDKCRYAFISTCLNSVSEFTIMFHLLSKMEVVDYYAESDNMFHILLKNNQREMV
jgi:hypothetical protein